MSLNKDSKFILAIYIQIVLCLFLALAYGFLSPYYLPAAKSIELQQPKISDKLVLVLMDGMRKDFAFDPKLMPNTYRLSQEGASGVSKTSSFPLTIAAMRALGSGVPYSARDILYNYQRVKTVTKTDKGKVRLTNKHGLDENVDSIFQEAYKKGRKIVLSGDDIWINCYGSTISEAILAKADADTPHGTTDDSDVHQGALSFLAEPDFDILIIHYQSLDRTGHNNTPLSGKYRKKALEVDRYIGELEEKLPPNTTLFIFSDHGQSDEGWHGKLDNPPPIVTEPPFIFAKHKIAKVQNLLVEQMDLAPTLAFLLGIPIPAQSEGITIDKIFDLSEKEKADLLLANLKARINYINQLETVAKIKLKLPTSQAQNLYQEGNFSQTINVAKTQLKQINDLVELNLKFNIKPFIKAYLLFSLLTFLLLIFTSSIENIPWLGLTTIFSSILGFGLIASIFLFQTSDPLEIAGNFLSIVFLELILLSPYLIYQLALHKDSFSFTFAAKHLFTLLALAIGMLFIILPNTLGSLYIAITLAIIVFFVYNYKKYYLFRFLLPLAILIFSSLTWLLNQPFFLESKLLKTTSIILVGVFVAISFKSFNSFFRVISIAIGIFSASLNLFHITSKVESVYILLFLSICLFMINLAVKEEKFVWPLLLTFLLVQFPIYSALPIVKVFGLSNIFIVISFIITTGLFYYIYHHFILSNNLTILTRNELISLMLPHLALVLAFLGRVLTRNPIRNELGKFCFLFLIISLVSYFIFPLRKEHRSYLLYICILALSVTTFEPLQILLVISVIFFQIWFTKKFASEIYNHSISLIVIYLAISFITYYNAYGNLSLSSFFEEGRYPILGAQITDYSYWNLTIIISFLVSKLVIVESIGLLVLTESAKEINSFARLIAGIFSLAIALLVTVVYFSYSPGNQQFLSNISSSLLFIGIKLVVFFLALLLINLTKISFKELNSEQEITAQGANLVA